MATKRSYNYEAMFLIGQNVAADLTGVIQHINEILARGNAEVIAMRKWDERKLAYEIRGQKRGLYILVYFRAPGPDVAHIERDCNLSEKILRALILRADHMTGEQMQAADARKELEVEAKLRAERPATPAPVAAAAAPADAGEDQGEAGDEA
ncbi:MAG TPA: 30S ribosomal protein S6 [Phycisphaerales bacterium]|nr:30S ribosomal protein S6 [Phycisphaerales bacterium]